MARTGSNTARQNILPSLQSWLQRAALADTDVEIAGEPAGRRFQVRLRPKETRTTQLGRWEWPCQPLAQAHR
eukprot:3593356-Pyramimonas_sp.AAC.1